MLRKVQLSVVLWNAGAQGQLHGPLQRDALHVRVHGALKVDVILAIHVAADAAPHALWGLRHAHRLLDVHGGSAVDLQQPWLQLFVHQHIDTEDLEALGLEPLLIFTVLVVLFLLGLLVRVVLFALAFGPCLGFGLGLRLRSGLLGDPRVRDVEHWSDCLQEHDDHLLKSSEELLLLKDAPLLCLLGLDLPHERGQGSLAGHAVRVKWVSGLDKPRGLLVHREVGEVHVVLVGVGSRGRLILCCAEPCQPLAAEVGIQWIRGCDHHVEPEVELETADEQRLGEVALRKGAEARPPLRLGQQLGFEVGAALRQENAFAERAIGRLDDHRVSLVLPQPLPQLISLIRQQPAFGPETELLWPEPL
mmetsp:Transcript_61670/g.190990  ORF Transcript_61670/g.190990 Transcript_61670/m.190990 type:complete len:362 (-) Transcript_61670:186-1271(-)